MILEVDTPAVLRGGPFDGDEFDAQRGMEDTVLGPFVNPFAECDGDRMIHAHYGCNGWTLTDDAGGGVARVASFVCIGLRRGRNDQDDPDLGRPPRPRQF